MREYMISVISVAALGRIAIGICPEGEEKKLKKAVSLILSLFFIISVARPVVVLVEKFSKNGESIIAFSDIKADEYTQVWYKTLENVSEQSIEDITEELLLNSFQLEKENYNINCVFDEGLPRYVEIELLGKGLFINPRKIEALLCEKLGCDVNVR